MLQKTISGNEKHKPLLAIITKGLPKEELSKADALYVIYEKNTYTTIVK